MEGVTVAKDDKKRIVTIIIDERDNKSKSFNITLIKEIYMLSAEYEDAICTSYRTEYQRVCTIISEKSYEEIYKYISLL